MISPVFFAETLTLSSAVTFPKIAASVSRSMWLYAMDAPIPVPPLTPIAPAA